MAAAKTRAVEPGDDTASDEPVGPEASNWDQIYIIATTVCLAMSVIFVVMAANKWYGGLGAD